jgi:Secretion system C-terminal sorting domain
MLKVYPTVSSGVLTIETSETAVYQVFNLLGKQVLTGKTGQRIDLSSLPQGTYIVRVGLEQALFIKR